MDKLISQAGQNQQLTFEKRKGTAAISGQLYEIELSILCLLLGTTNERIENFLLAANMDKAGSFDDVVFKYKYKDDGGKKNTKIIFLQAKHRENAKQEISFATLLSNNEKGDFRLKKYFDAYRDIKHQFSKKSNADHPIFGCNFKDSDFIIYTNTLITYCKHEEENIKKMDIEKESIFNLKEKNNHYYQLTLGGNKKNEIIYTLMSSSDCKKFSKNNPNHPLPNNLTNEDEIKEFLNKLKLIVDQPNQNELRKIIKHKIQSLYSMKQYEVDVIYYDVQNKVQKWWKEEDKYLTKNHQLFEDAKQNLSKLRLTELAVLRSRQIKKLELTFNNDLIENMIQLIRNKQILNIVTNKSTVLLSSAKVYQALESMIEYKSENCDYRYILMSLTSVLDFQNKVIDTFKSKINNLLLIECEYIEGDIMELYQELSTIITSNDNKKIILITPENNTLTTKFKDEFSKDGIYEEKQDENNNLIDLTDESQEKLLDKVKVMFQGEEISLDMLIGEESKYLVNAEILLRLINNEKIEIGEAPFDLGEIKYYYIDRIFNRQVKIKEDFQMETSKFFVTHSSQITKLDLKQDKDILLISDTDYHFNQLCNHKKYEKFNIHWLKYERETFMWQQSRGALSKLREFIETNNISEYPIKKITDIADKVVIISAEAGMGKSTVLTKLAEKTKKTDPSLWIVRINLNDYTENLNKINFNENKDQQALDFLLDVVVLKTPVEKELFKCRMNQGKVALLFDGFDEISPTYKDKVIELVNILKDTKVEKIWITTRPHMRSELEDKLSILSYTLKPLSKEDQKKFLERFWNKKLDLNLKVNDNRLNNYIKCLLEVLSNSIADREIEFTGISLQTRMLAEAYQDKFKEFHDSDQDRPNLPDKLNLVDLYQLFINKKYNIYCEDKKKEDLTKPSVQSDHDELRPIFKRKHKLLALNTLFSDLDVNALLSQEDKEELINFKRKVKKGEEKTGIVNQIINDRPTFIHRTFAEYFAADWLTNNKDNRKVENFLRNNIFEDENEVLRNFFDRILAQDEQGENKYEVHIAVLNKDRNGVDNLLSDARRAKDIINSYDKSGRTVLHLAAAYGYDEIVKILLEKFADIGISDNIFGWRPISYADKGSYWSTAELILKKGASGNDMYEAIRNVKTTYERERTLLHMAAQEGYVKFAEVLVGKGADVDAQDKYNRTPLHEATSNGNLFVAKFLGEKGANVAAKDDDNRTPLHMVVLNGKLDILKYLIGKDAEIDAKDKYNRTPLHEAATNGNLEMVKYLVEKGAEVNAKDNNNRTPLHMVALNGNLDVVEYLVSKGAEVDAKDNNNRTPLHEAASNSNLDVIEYLRGNGADVDAKDDNNRTSLHVAAWNGKLDVVEYLVEKGAEVDAKDDDNRSPLHMVVLNGKLDIVEYLVGKGADIDAKDNNNRTPLHEAAFNADLDVVKYLVGKRASVDAKDNDNITPLHKAASRGNLNVVKYLVRKGADVDAKNNFTETSLQMATSNDNLDVVKYLVGKGADVDAKNDSNRTSLHMAALNGKLDVVKYLVEKGADIYAKDNDNKTPLHFAVSRGKLNVVEYRVGKGAEVDVKDNDNKSLLHMAAWNGKLDVVEYLVKKGADICAKDNDNKTPLHIAVLRDKLDVVEYLVGKGG